MRVRVAGRYWLLIPYDTELPRSTDGKCDPPTHKRKTIRIRSSLKGKPRLETIVHELMHACNWTLDEEHVTEAAEDIANILWKLGYRTPEDK